ncbi:MAG: hypothetical protein K9M15_00240 [Candidatus Marinimicrobia bacterium]|nr:hypothetical protein [Candidatus Neomarinimicrobiota bacterium]
MIHLSFLGILVTISLMSFVGVLGLLGYRIFFSRHLRKEELVENVSLEKRFFGVFDSIFSCISNFLTSFINFLKIFFVNNLIFIFSLIKRTPVPFRSKISIFLRQMQGKQLIKQKKCKGYWRKVNDYKVDEENKE